MSFRAALEATWPAAETRTCGGFLLRRGAGGGKRVSAASHLGGAADLAAVEAAQRDWGQKPLFVLWPEDGALDADLAARGYRKIDPVVGYQGRLATALPPLAAFAHWPPLAIQREIWAEGEIGPERVAVMERVQGPKAAILARSGDQPAGAGFVAVADGMAMIHAVEVRPSLRRQGVGRHILQAAARFAAEHGAETLALAVTEGNTAARALYSSLGMQVVEHYHYRILDR